MQLEEIHMYAITGITGQVGGEVARNLLQAGLTIRAVVRNPEKGEPWKNQGCTIALADLNDQKALTLALKEAKAAFILLPPAFDPLPGFTEAKNLARSIRAAIEEGKPERVVYVSTVGAQAHEENLLTQHTIVEETLRECSVPITFLRPAWFMENAAWDVGSAKKDGVISSFLQPLDRRIPMVATADIGRVAAQLLQEKWTGHRVIELEGPRLISPNDIANAFSEILRKPVKAQIVPRESWESLFKSQGTKNPMPRIRMIDGFNEGWINFSKSEKEVLKGKVELESVLRSHMK
jgi:uncharacterized protein YbjT (DUF2867 family)